VPQKKEFEIYGHHVHVSFLNHDFWSTFFASGWQNLTFYIFNGLKITSYAN
jgi:hypothetical protein